MLCCRAQPLYRVACQQLNCCCCRRRMWHIGCQATTTTWTTSRCVKLTRYVGQVCLYAHAVECGQVRCIWEDAAIGDHCNAWVCDVKPIWHLWNRKAQKHSGYLASLAVHTPGSRFSEGLGLPTIGSAPLEHPCYHHPAAKPPCFKPLQAA